MKCKIENVKCKMARKSSGIFNFKFCILHSNHGFTLPELLVSISIFVIITTAVVANFRSSEESGQLRLGAQAVASTLRSLQTMAQTGRLTALCDDASRAVCTGNTTVCGTEKCVASLPSGGYGMQIMEKTGTITLFADGKQNHKFDTGEALVDMALNLPRNVIIDSTTTPYDSVSNTLTISFEPPEPTIWINGAATVTTQEAHIVLRHEKTKNTKTIVLRRISGRIEINN
ncbi:MAG: prepilin-type N-terminal cleavage/methylation domain-containing protein [bacterium]|nr:prepilin-type N-terminal cleavage/methylation domain-containing protein [bacterium]